MIKLLATTIAVFLLYACTAIPTAPSVLVLPGTGKGYGQFQDDDLMCRKLTQLQSTRTLNESGFDEEEGQQIYDIYYIQCMYSKGHRVPVPGEFKYDTQKDWHPPPPPNMPAPPQTTIPGTSYNPMR